jgi:hypothetical protein
MQRGALHVLPVTARGQTEQQLPISKAQQRPIRYTHHKQHYFAAWLVDSGSASGRTSAGSTAVLHMGHLPSAARMARKGSLLLGMWQLGHSHQSARPIRLPVHQRVRRRSAPSPTAAQPTQHPVGAPHNPRTCGDVKGDDALAADALQLALGARQVAVGAGSQALWRLVAPVWLAHQQLNLPAVLVRHLLPVCVCDDEHKGWHRAARRPGISTHARGRSVWVLRSVRARETTTCTRAASACSRALARFVSGPRAGTQSRWMSGWAPRA